MQRLVFVLAALAALVALDAVLPAPGAAAGAWWSLLPPLLAITLALALREVLVALFLGVWLGAAMARGGLAAGALAAIDGYVRGALADPDHVAIIVFSMFLGGMVGVMSKAGGTHGIVRALEPLATTARRSQVITWAMGVAIFFDDYANTLIVGNTMRPVTDAHRVSREKLAYLVDSTAAPVATIAFVSTWVGYQVSLLGDALREASAPHNPFALFLGSIPYAFYPVLALAVGLVSALSGRDWGPMLAAERRARGGELLAARARPLADYESTGLAPDSTTPARWWNAALPVATVVGGTLVGLYATGRAALLAEGGPAGDLRRVIGASDPFRVLLWASFAGLAMAVALAVGQRLLAAREALEAAVQGFKSMLLAAVVLTLAWSLGSVCADLDTAGFLVRVVGPHLAAHWIPAVVFLVAAGVSFATGTSWGTMAILTPLAVPLVLHSAETSLHPQLLSATVAAILGGAVFGDHCSPISDTTIMSSMASSCDHVDHVRTQLPYALLGAALAVAVGYVPIGLGELSPWPLVPLAIAGVWAWFRFVGRPVEEPGGR